MTTAATTGSLGMSEHITVRLDGTPDLATLTNAGLAAEARRRHEAVQTIQAELKRRKGEH